MDNLFKGASKKIGSSLMSLIESDTEVKMQQIQMEACLALDSLLVKNGIDPNEVDYKINVKSIGGGEIDVEVIVPPGLGNDVYDVFLAWDEAAKSVS